MEQYEVKGLYVSFPARMSPGRAKEKTPVDAMSTGVLFRRVWYDF